MSSAEDMNAALFAEKLCWTARAMAATKSSPGVAMSVLCDASHPAATVDARNKIALRSYVLTSRTKGVTLATFAAAMRDAFDGDPTALDAISAMPNV